MALSDRYDPDTKHNNTAPPSTAFNWRYTRNELNAYPTRLREHDHAD